jgi:hypothetical protein
MSETWYRARFGEIDPVVVRKVTADYVCLEGHNGRDKKLTDWCSYFKTAEEAKQWLIANAEQEIEGLESRLKGARIRLKAAQSLTANPPK